MIDAKQIPDEVVTAVLQKFPLIFSNQYEARLFLAAALNAWPSARQAHNGSSVSLAPHIILPLPKEGERVEHTSDCAVHNEPAARSTKCDCGLDALLNMRPTL